MAPTHWLSPREEADWRALQFMHLRLDGALARELSESSVLSYPDYVVLVALTDQPDHRLRLSALAETLGWERSRLSHHVSRMRTRGHVDKVPCVEDRRGAIVVATPEGIRELRRAAPGHVAAVRRLFIDRLTTAQLSALGDAARAVLGGLDADADGAAD